VSFDQKAPAAGQSKKADCACIFVATERRRETVSVYELTYVCIYIHKWMCNVYMYVCTDMHVCLVCWKETFAGEEITSQDSSVKGNATNTESFSSFEHTHIYIYVYKQIYKYTPICINTRILIYRYTHMYIYIHGFMEYLLVRGNAANLKLLSSSAARKIKRSIHNTPNEAGCTW